VELAFWLALGTVKAAANGHALWQPLLQSLALYAADNFGNITIGIATTAYVIFTYHLLETTEAHHRQAVEPYLTLRWLASDQSGQHQVTGG
jgi:hypothetical protein